MASTEHGDGDAASTADKRMLDLRAKLDDVEAALEWPFLVEWTNRVLHDAAGLIDEYGDPDDRRRLERDIAAVRRALAGRDTAHLRTLVEELTRQLSLLLDRKTGAVAMARFSQLVEQRAVLTDQALAARLIAEGERAVRQEDLDALRLVNRQLVDLLPDVERPADPGGGSSVYKPR